MINSNNENPLVSIVTATYKRFEKVLETIKSVFEQDYPNIEYIITDDGSENFPEKEINDFINSNSHENVKCIKIIRSEQNCGTVKNLNKGYRASNGKFIFNLSCGDIFFSKETKSDASYE